MPKNPEIKKVLVVGSGPIVIGQAAEFDYAGTQACRALKEEGIETVLVNSNPATIMTDVNIADKVYIEPLTPETLEKIITVEKPDSILATLGGQTGLNLVMELAEEGFLEDNGVKIIGTNAETIKKAEDRLAFKNTLESIGEPCVESKVVNSLEEAVDFSNSIGYPVVVRPAYTLGGTGGGIASDLDELKEIASSGLRSSRVGQVLIEKSIAGWKEIEFEVIRDSHGNCITVCGMENIDPVGVHTGDSIVVAPCQTLTEDDFNMLKNSAIKIVKSLGIEGGCNVQFALNPLNSEYAVIEVNPRLSRSSALASKAAGYPIAKVATKIALGYALNEIENVGNGSANVFFEPVLDYVAVKIPKWPFDKFVTAKRTLGTQMKATGEVMAINLSFEGALMKAIRSLEQGLDGLELPESSGLSKLTDEEVINHLYEVDDRRLFVVAEAIRRGVDINKINEITKIDLWFLNKVAGLVEMEEQLKVYFSQAERGFSQAERDFSQAQRNFSQAAEEELKALLMKAKEMGFTDSSIARYAGMDKKEVRTLRQRFGITASFRVVNTCNSELGACAPYYYSCYNRPNEVDNKSDKKKVIVLGSGPIRIGQGIEFDYCSVHSVWALKECGCETIIVNNNPETVSTDFDVADKLYFEPLTAEDVQNIVEHEKPFGAVVQFGGQTAIKLTKDLVEMGVQILGTSLENIDNAEDREKFDAILEKCGIPRPKGRTVFTLEEALKAANELGYPVLVRPSYVLGGQGMDIAFSDQDTKTFMEIINRTVQEHPVLIDKYITGKEVEVDAICDGKDILIPGIMEHLERAGIHSGDSISVYPTQTISQNEIDTIVDYTRKLALAMDVKGLINIQYIVNKGDVYVIEANPRSSRTVPYISKVTGIPMVSLATKALLGQPLSEMGYGTGLYPSGKYNAVKMPVFSFEKIVGADIGLGPEMKSTGEVLGISESFSEALVKAFKGAGIKISAFGKRINTKIMKIKSGDMDRYTGRIAISVKDRDKDEIVDIAREFAARGYDIYATIGTCKFLIENGVYANPVGKISGGVPVDAHFSDILELISKGGVDLVIDTPTHGRQDTRDGFKIRRAAIENGIPCLTAIDTAKALLESLKYGDDKDLSVVNVAEIFHG